MGITLGKALSLTLASTSKGANDKPPVAKLAFTAPLKVAVIGAGRVGSG